MSAYNIMKIKIKTGVNAHTTLIVGKEDGEMILDLLEKRAMLVEYYGAMPIQAHNGLEVSLVRHEELRTEEQQLWRKLHTNPFKRLPIMTASGLRDDSTEEPDIPDMTPY